MSYTITTKTQLVSITVGFTGDQVAALAGAADTLRRVINAQVDVNPLTPVRELVEDLERIHAANSSQPRPIKGRKSRSQAPIGG
jgi:hypothetical protein